MLLATKVRKGNIILLDGELYSVMGTKHVTPGKGHAHVQLKLRSLSLGNQREERFNSSDRVEKAILETKPAEYLYEENGIYYFMDNETYEQIEIQADFVGDAAGYLLPNTTVSLTVHEGRTLGIELPKVVELTVVECPPNMKGATATAQTKPATMETGIIIQVPPFIAQGEKIRVDPESGEYVERVK
jgi:elongation factor P